MATKYIVNNVTGQTISGDLTIEGNLVVTGTSNNDGFVTYKALLTQTGPIVGTNLGGFDYGLIIGETYTITNYVDTADFSNIANVQSGTINQTGCVFVATGSTPNSWADGTELTSSGNLLVDVLENTLGFDIDWVQAPFGGFGYYLGFNSFFGPLYNMFPRSQTEVKSQLKYPFGFGSPTILPPIGFPGVSSVNTTDSAIYLEVYYDGDLTNNGLYYTPIEINIKKLPDTPLIQTYGFNTSSFPYGNVSVRVFAGSNNVATFYNDTYTVVNDINEMVAKLNSDPGTNYLGTYSVNQGVTDGVILTITQNIKNQFSPNNTLTFEVFND